MQWAPWLPSNSLCGERCRVFSSGNTQCSKLNGWGCVDGCAMRPTKVSPQNPSILTYFIYMKIDYVSGVVEGPEGQAKQMQLWLRNTGSPKSRIDDAKFTGEKQIAQYSFPDFARRSTPKA